MKIPLLIRSILWLTLTGLWCSGLMVWILSHWFQIEVGGTHEPRPDQVLWLHFHGVVGLWFLFLFGYLFKSHIQPAWAAGKKRRSGGTLAVAFAILAVSVPGLYYLSEGAVRWWTIQTHTYLGMASLAFFGIHLFWFRSVAKD